MSLPGTGAVTYHLKKHHKEAWDLYTEKRTHAQEKTTADKKDVEDACEMSNSTVRFFDTRTNGGRQPYLAKVCAVFLNLFVPLFDPDPISFLSNALVYVSSLPTLLVIH